MTSKHPETLALHAGWRRDSATNAVAVPIYQTTSYQFDSSEHALNLFAPQGTGQYLHAHHEPDAGRAEAAARRARGRSSPLWASRPVSPRPAFSPVLNVARNGDNIVSSTDLYGGTCEIFSPTR